MERSLFPKSSTTNISNKGDIIKGIVIDVSSLVLVVKLESGKIETIENSNTTINKYDIVGIERGKITTIEKEDKNIESFEVDCVKEHSDEIPLNENYDCYY